MSLRLSLQKVFHAQTQGKETFHLILVRYTVQGLPRERAVFSTWRGDLWSLCRRARAMPGGGRGQQEASSVVGLWARRERGGEVM